MTPRTLAVTDPVSVTGLSVQKDNHHSKLSNKPNHAVLTQRSIMDHPRNPICYLGVPGFYLDVSQR